MRIFAEIQVSNLKPWRAIFLAPNSDLTQMALSTYDFSSLASKYDRIMNASRGAECAHDPSKRSRQADAIKSIIALIGKISAAYDMPFNVDTYAHTYVTLIQLKP